MSEHAPGTVSADEIAECLAGEGRPALSRAAISNFVRDGMPKAARGRYPERECMRWYIGRLRNTVQQRSTETPDGAIMTLDDAQIRLTTAKAENEEMTAKERRGELMPLSLHVSEVAKLITVTKQKFLNLPARLAPKMEGLSRVEGKALLTAATKAALQELALGEESTSSSSANGSRPKAEVGRTHRQRSSRQRRG